MDLRSLFLILFSTASQRLHIPDSVFTFTLFSLMSPATHSFNLFFGLLTSFISSCSLFSQHVVVAHCHIIKPLQSSFLRCSGYLYCSITSCLFSNCVPHPIFQHSRFCYFQTFLVTYLFFTDQVSLPSIYHLWPYYLAFFPGLSLILSLQPFLCLLYSAPFLVSPTTIKFSFLPLTYSHAFFLLGISHCYKSWVALLLTPTNSSVAQHSCFFFSIHSFLQDLMRYFRI